MPVRAAIVAGAGAVAAIAFAVRVALAPISTAIGPLRIRARSPGDAVAVAVAFAIGCLLLAGGLRAARWIAAAGALLVAATALAALAVRAPHGLPVGDAALLESYTLLTTQGRLLLGPYSRFAWHHPGPVYFWVLAPFYVLAGYDTPGLNVGALFVNVASIAALVWTVRRFARDAFGLVLLATIALYAWRVRDLMVGAWNPHVTVLAAAALAPIAAATAAGGAGLLPLVALFATFIVQTHIGFAPYAMALCACAGGGLWVAVDRHPGTAPSVRSILNRTAWLLAILWSFPLADQLTRTPGNMTRLLRFFVVENQGGQPASQALHAWADATTAAMRGGFHIPAGILFVPDPSVAPVIWAVLQVLLLGVCAAWCARRGRAFESWLGGILALASIVTFASVLRITENLVDHELYWMSAIGMLGTGTIVAVAATAAWERRPGRAVPPALLHVASAAPIAIAIVFGVLGLRGTDRLPFGIRQDDRIVRVLTDGIRSHLSAAGAHKPLVRMDVTTWGYAAGVVLQLERDGGPVAVEDGDVPLFSDAVGVDGREDLEVTIARQPKQAALAARPGNVVVAAIDGLFVDAVPIAPNANR